ncbi:MAG: SUMF1/EgtB/PvdO family nonheme iron enzyme [Spirochaetes bacterium]|nr:SUMF1/EgtB/PvdO family nonheme iron enzyme [Spirochaetota bacterium]MBU1079273.1 SUMF1/EgtB/PvdO family nonheme iron enzyme [Spirochaetota bacterium]
MNDDKTITRQDIDEAKVSLRPVFGIAPKYYVAAIYGVAALAVAFLLLVFPGLRKPGTLYSFVVDPPGAAISIDGVYRGSAPCELFLAAGERSVSISRPGFAPSATAVIAKGRVFGTLVVKPRATLTASLEIDGRSAALRDGASLYASWALAGSPSEAYQIPLVLSDAALALSKEPLSTEARGLAGAAVSYASHAQSLRDAARAVSIAYSDSAAVTPASLGRLVSALSSELRDDPAMLAAFASLVPATVRARIEPTGLYREAVANAVAAARRASAVAGGTETADGKKFIAVRAGTAVVAARDALPASSEVAGFMIASEETTVGEFRRFVAARPDWGPSAAASLARAGLAETDYLQGFGDLADEDVLRYVSRPAAIAYCSWLSERAPSGYRYSLPTEAQWTLAAAAGRASPAGVPFADSGATGPSRPSGLPSDAAGLKGMLGNVWEWCSDSYSSSPASGAAGRSRFPSAEAVVRGGCWANRASLVRVDSRGPMRESECSPYLGFRIVLAPYTE